MIVFDDATDPYHPTSVRASMGAIFSQNIIKAGWEGFVEWKKTNSQILIGASCGNNAFNYHQYNYPEEMILLLGSEQKGLNDIQLKVCDDLVTVPMKGKADSLNLANAASIILIEISNQHDRCEKQ